MQGFFKCRHKVKIAEDAAESKHVTREFHKALCEVARADKNRQRLIGLALGNQALQIGKGNPLRQYRTESQVINRINAVCHRGDVRHLVFDCAVSVVPCRVGECGNHLDRPGIVVPMAGVFHSCV